MFKFYKLLAFSVFSSLSILVLTNIARAWGPEYDYGICKIDNGKEIRGFECLIARGGGTGGFSMTIYKSFNNSEIGTFNTNTSDIPPTTIFEWANGRTEKVRGVKWNGSNWTYWIERGWAISFYETDGPMHQGNLEIP